MRRLGRKRFLAGLACGLTGIGLRKEPSARRKDDGRRALVYDFQTFSYARLYGGFLAPLREMTCYSYDAKPLAALSEGADGSTELKVVTKYVWQGSPLQNMVSRTVYDSCGRIIARYEPAATTEYGNDDGTPSTGAGNVPGGEY